MRRGTTSTGLTALALVAALALAACGRSDDPTAGADADTTTTVGDGPATGNLTIWAEGAEGDALKDFAVGFTKENPDVKIDVTSIPWASAHDKFVTAVAAGNTPDLAMVGTTWMADFKDAFAPVPSDVETGDLFSGALDADGLALPWYVDTRVLFYRTDLAKKAGWDSAPTTWDELEQLASDYQTKAGTKFGMRMPSGGDGSFRDSLWLPWSNGASLTNSDNTAWTLDSAPMVEAYDYLASFFTKKISDPDADISTGAAEADFVSGRTPMFVGSPASVSTIASVGGDGFDSKYATAVLPAAESSTSFLGGSNLAVFKKSGNQSSAWKFIEWMLEPAQQVAWYKATGDLPASQKAWDDATLSSDAKLAVFGKQLESAEAPPTSTSWKEVSVAAEGAVEKIARGKQTAAEALKALQSQAGSIGVG
ncbi:sugar ABC transporter substrate-binding protein [Luteimicrobium album]|uniref:Sugar ABC transporter substrate-binding protein n=1 Tax=Luteimicrobium album TaxID=1054550 RepID=A0ABQ6HYR0_9MICO|nr:extracellular solute-binding protein [Luteimicrobium album]GMA23601.1 sugar ABC transporter substrate-binding protein [Luteimicrobium album]